MRTSNGKKPHKIRMTINMLSYITNRVNCWDHLDFFKKHVFHIFRNFHKCVSDYFFL